MYVSRVMYRVSNYLCSVNKNVKEKKKCRWKNFHRQFSVS